MQFDAIVGDVIAFGLKAAPLVCDATRTIARTQLMSRTLWLHLKRTLTATVRDRSLRLATLLAVGLLISQPAHAASIVLTGGDPGEGFAPLASTFGALNLGASSSVVIQGITFGLSDPNFVVNGAFSASAGLGSLGASANDVAMNTLFQTVVGANPGPFTLTVSGLTVGSTYQFDFFFGATGNGRTERFSSSGSSTVVDDVDLISGTGLDVRQVLMPNASGQVVTTFSSIAGFPFAFINGVSVTSSPAVTPVPEPTSMLLLSTGIVGFGARRWRNRRQRG